MDKCPDCKLQKKAENCQKCFLAEQMKRKSIERKYIATVVLLDKFYAATANIMNPGTKKEPS